MSFNRLNSDSCTYRHNLKQSVGAADYMLNEPNIECQTCFKADPNLRMSNKARRSTGVSLCDGLLIDVDSELKNINKAATNCPTEKYIPGKKFCNLKHFKDCQTTIPVENTYISNPGSTLRGTGWNRFEWLCKNPQENALVPFDFNINNRIIVKDNHRPCVPEPIDQTFGLPNDNTPHPVANESLATPVDPIFTTHWRNCKTYAGYVE